VAALLTANLYGAVRGAIDTTLDDEALPDDVIEQPTYAAAAELELLRRDPDAVTRTGSERTHMLNALVFLTAARLVQAIPQLITERQGDYSYSRTQINGLDRAATLRGLASDELAAYLTDTAVPGVIFAVAHGYRGR
jgi:hypothetical protein